MSAEPRAPIRERVKSSPAAGGDLDDLFACFEIYRAVDGMAPPPQRPRLLTRLRGMPLATEVEVVHAGDHRVTFAVDAYQANALVYTREALISSPLHGATFFARGCEVDVATRYATFSHLAPHLRAEDERHSPRLQVDEAVAMRITRGRHVMHGRLRDFSVAAVAGHFDAGSTAALVAGDCVDVQVELPPLVVDGVTPAFAGTVSRVVGETGSDDLIVVATWSLDTTSLRSMSRYIVGEHARLVRRIGRQHP